MEDPNYSPDPTCRPRLLFPEAHKKRKAAPTAKKSAGKKRLGGGWDSDSDVDEEALMLTNVKQQPKPVRTAVRQVKAKNAAAASSSSAAKGSSSSKTKSAGKAMLDDELKKVSKKTKMAHVVEEDDPFA